MPAQQNFDALDLMSFSDTMELVHQNPSDYPIDLSKNTFSKEFHLLTPAEFKFVFENAKKFANRHWTLIVRPNNKNYPRLGLTIAKKQLIRAVWRNRVKRLAREAFRQHKQDLNGYDIVVLGRRDMQKVDNETLTKSFKHLIRKIKNSDLKNI
jgi:ribonuclease P protein component